MAEKWLVPLVVLMMGIGVLYAFDEYYAASGPTGFVVNTASGQSICSDTDNNDPGTVGVTISDIYEGGQAQDTCVGSDLLEYYCGPDGADVRVVNCQRGCSFGACN